MKKLFFIFVAFFFYITINTTTISAQTIVTPTVYCLGSCNTATNPTKIVTPRVNNENRKFAHKKRVTTTNEKTTQTIKTSGSNLEDCEITIQSSWRKHRKHHHHRGLMRGIWNQLLELLKQYNITLPNLPIDLCTPSTSEGNNTIIATPTEKITEATPTTSQEEATPTVIMTTNTPTTTPTQTTQTDRISVAFYPGWYQSSTGPDQINYTPWTHIMHFGFFPNNSGGIDFTDSDPSYPAPAISAAHAAGKKILVTIGGAGSGDGFVSSTKASTLPTFVSNIVALMEEYGYDGVDIDWEENVTQTEFVNLITSLRAALPASAILSVDVDSDLVPPSFVAPIASDVDIINVMSYWDNGSNMLEAYLNEGIPANKLTMGIGFSPELYDQTESNVQEKTSYAEQQDLLGVMMWSLEDVSGSNDSRLNPISAYISGN